MRSRWSGRWAMVAAAGLVAGATYGAEWGGPAAGGAPVASLSSISAAVSGSGRVTVAGVRLEAGVPRIFLSQAAQGTWTAANGGLPADGGAAAGPVRSPVLTTDPNGGAYLVYARHDGESAWRLYARRWDGVTISDVDGGHPLDAGTGTVNAFATAVAAQGGVHVLYTRFDGSRMALQGAWRANSGWQQANDGKPVDAGGAGWSDAPAIAADSDGGMTAVYTQETDAGRRLRALRLGGGPLAARWEPLDDGASLDRADLGNVSAPAIAVTDAGRALVAYLQEDGAGIPRLYAVIREGGVWLRLNGGEPLDGSPAGVGDVAVTPHEGGALIAYTTIDAVEGVAEPRLHALEVRGAKVIPMNGGAALDVAGGGLAGVDLAGGWLVFEQSAGLVRARSLAAPVAPVAAATAAAMTDGLVVTGAVFRPAAGERAGLAWTATTPQEVRVTIHSITGEPVAVLADGPAAGTVAMAWDGRDAGGRNVAPGVYVVRATGGTFRRSAKLVVVQ